MITKPRKVFIKNLTDLLKEKDKSQMDLSRDLNIPLSTISSWVNGQGYPRVDKMQMLADYFNVSMRRLTDEWGTKDYVLNSIGRASEKMSDDELDKMIEVLKVMFKDKFEN